MYVFLASPTNDKRSFRSLISTSLMGGTQGAEKRTFGSDKF